MFPRAHHLHPSLWPLALAATLALAPGCAVDPEGEFVTTRTVRGTLALQYVPRKPQVIQVPTVASSTPLDIWLRQELAAARERRRLNALTEQDTRREREELFRQEQRDLEAYRTAREQTLRGQRAQERERDQVFQQQQSRWFENQRLRAQAESAQWAQASKPSDTVPPQEQRQESSLQQAWQSRSLRLGQ